MDQYHGQYPEQNDVQPADSTCDWGIVDLSTDVLVPAARRCVSWHGDVGGIPRCDVWIPNCSSWQLFPAYPATTSSYLRGVHLSV